MNFNSSLELDQTNQANQANQANSADSIDSHTPFWQQLQQEQLYLGKSLPHAQSLNTPHTLWYVRVMLGFAGWVAALFLIGFVLIGFEFLKESPIASMMMGVLFCAVAYAMLRMASHKENDFFEQFGMAVSLAGQALLLIGLLEQFKDNIQAILIFACAIEVFLIVIMPNTTHRFLSSLASILAMTIFLKEYAIHDLMLGLIAVGAVWLWLSKQIVLKPSMWTPIAYAFVCALLWFEIGRMTPLFRSAWSGEYYWWLRTAWWSGMLIEAIVCLVATYLLLKRYHISQQSTQAYWAYVAIVLIAIMSYFAPGMASAALVMILGFAAGSRVVLGFGILGLLGFLSHYYYTMQSTLLHKSAVLAILGIVLLVIRFIFQRAFVSTSHNVQNPQNEQNAQLEKSMQNMQSEQEIGAKI